MNVVETAADLASLITARLDELQHAAEAASREDPHPAPPGGAHWIWVDMETDEPLNLAEQPDGIKFTALHTTEHVPTGNAAIPTFPMAPIHRAVYVSTTAAQHIVLHDPAAVLTDIAGRRLLLSHLLELAKWRRPIGSQAIRALQAIAASLPSVPAP